VTSAFGGQRSSENHGFLILYSHRHGLRLGPVGSRGYLSKPKLPNTRPNSASLCATSFREPSRRIAKCSTPAGRARAQTHYDFVLLVSNGSPILGSREMLIVAIRVRIHKSARKKGVVTSLKPGSATPAERVSGAPDSRLVELVRLLARRAARQWYEKMLREPGQLRS
jgi:hypothetical protein